MSGPAFVSGIIDAFSGEIEIPDLRFFLDPIVTALEIVAVAFIIYRLSSIIYGAVVITILLIKAGKKGCEECR